MVSDPVLRCWLSTVLAAQRLNAQMPAAGQRERFEQHLRSLWTRWMHAHQLSFPEQVIELFGKFSDETVALDSKTGRLPKFDRIDTHRADAAPAPVYLVADAAGKRWCAAVQTGRVDENAVSRFEEFCRGQTPKPSRKVVVLQSGMQEAARVMAKAANMWVWEPADFNLLLGLYEQG
jgi:hypothetical protein